MEQKGLDEKVISVAGENGEAERSAIQCLVATSMVVGWYGMPVAGSMVAQKYGRAEVWQGLAQPGIFLDGMVQYGRYSIGKVVCIMIWLLFNGIIWQCMLRDTVVR